jgi:hypothetical protein
MRCHLLRAAAIFVLACGVSSAAEPPPACTKSNRGQVWPEEAARDPKLYSKLARCGELLVCTQGSKRSHWESPTVRLDQLRGGSKLPIPVGCEASSEPQKDEQLAAPSATN